MKLCAFEVAGVPHLGVLARGYVTDLTSSDPELFGDLHSLYAEARRRKSGIPRVVADALEGGRRLRLRDVRLRIPVVPREIWAAGVTYFRSRVARETETKTKGLYDYVYTSKRPELFLKDTGLRCVGPGDEICVRGDSSWSVPEPELAVLVDRDAKVLGYTVGNDVSSRDIEGESPLFLPQAKIYRGSSSIGPVITTADEIRDPRSLRIGMRIIRSRREVFEGSVNTSKMKRSVKELVSFLSRNNILSDFTVLMTGTAIVPPDDFTLKGGDTVEIEIEKIGVLRNPVRRLGAPRRSS